MSLKVLVVEYTLTDEEAMLSDDPNILFEYLKVREPDVIELDEIKL